MVQWLHACQGVVACKPRMCRKLDVSVVAVELAGFVTLTPFLKSKNDTFHGTLPILSYRY